MYSEIVAKVPKYNIKCILRYIYKFYMYIRNVKRNLSAAKKKKKKNKVETEKTQTNILRRKVFSDLTQIHTCTYTVPICTNSLHTRISHKYT